VPVLDREVLRPSDRGESVTAFLIILEVVILIPAVWALIDAARRSRASFAAVGESKGKWISLIVGGSVVLGIAGLILALIYLVSIRPKLAGGPTTTGSNNSPHDTSRRPWAWFGLWALTGACYAMVIAGAFTIGVFFVPAAIVITVLLARSTRARRAMAGLIAGLAVPLIVVASLNRAGPGLVCTTDDRGTGQTCAQQWNPWLFLAGAAIALAVGVLVFVRANPRDPGARCAACSTSLPESAHYCGHCGTPTSH
jgi:hypothetical protein